MSPDSLSPRLKTIKGACALHDIIASVRQLSYMKEHSQTLSETLNVKLEITYTRAPVRGQSVKRQTYELERSERPDPSGRERLLEKRIWGRCRVQPLASPGPRFFGDVCPSIQTYQMPLQETRKDKGWGKIDLVGVTSEGLPVVIELKQDRAKDTPLRMLVEGLAYACAVRKAWNEGTLRAQWTAAMKKSGVTPAQKQVLPCVPVILLAPSDFWRRAIGSPGRRSDGKVPDAAWRPFSHLVQKCQDHGFPIHFLEFELGSVLEPEASEAICVLPVQIPELPGVPRTV